MLPFRKIHNTKSAQIILTWHFQHICSALIVRAKFFITHQTKQTIQSDRQRRLEAPHFLCAYHLFNFGFFCLIQTKQSCGYHLPLSPSNHFFICLSIPQFSMNAISLKLTVSLYFSLLVLLPDRHRRIPRRTERRR